jgi:(p)ppGpp synthase/HD superfamily hydrolase
MSGKASKGAFKITGRFDRAVEYARKAHEGQYRKGTQVPYLSHLLGVASLVLDYGGDEDQAIAGLLHDVVEDQGEHHLEIVREKFGDRVARIVESCTDGTLEGKTKAQTPSDERADWQRRKDRYLKHLARAPKYALLVSGADKLHNARAVLQDVRDPALRFAVFDRFKTGREGTLWYYRSIADLLLSRGAPMARELDVVVIALESASRE